MGRMGAWLVVGGEVWEDKEGGVEKNDVVVRGGGGRVRRSLWKCRLLL